MMKVNLLGDNPVSSRETPSDVRGGTRWQALALLGGLLTTVAGGCGGRVGDISGSLRRTYGVFIKTVACVGFGNTSSYFDTECKAVDFGSSKEVSFKSSATNCVHFEGDRGGSDDVCWDPGSKLGNPTAVLLDGVPAELD